MFYSLRHISLRIWATVLVGGLISLWILPAFHPRIGLGWCLVPALGIMIAVFMAVGLFSNRLGLSAVERFIKEATTWERVGAYRGAEEAYKKATGVLDSFLLSPIVKRKESIKLSARLARFYLARADKNHSSESFIISYLQSHPEDEEVAENWLQQSETHGGLKTDHYELASRIGNAQPNNTVIQHLLARFYLSEGRTDFPALQIYKQVLISQKDGTLEVARETDIYIVKDLAMLFLREGRADEWALRIYLQAFRLKSDRDQLLRGIAACVHWIQENERTTHLLKQAHKYLVNLDEMQLKSLRTGFNPPGPEPIEQKISVQLRPGTAIWKAVRQVGSSIFTHITSTALELTARARVLSNHIKRSRRSKLIIKWAMMTILAVGVIILMINTVGHLIKTKRALYEKENH